MAKGDRRPCPQCGALNYAADDICVSCGYDLPAGGPRADLPALATPGPETDGEADGHAPQATAAPVQAAQAPAPRPPAIQCFKTRSYLRHAVATFALFVLSSVALLHGCGALLGGVFGDLIGVFYGVLFAVGLVFVNLPLARAGLGRPGARSWPLRLRGPAALPEGTHEVVGVSPRGAVAVGAVVGTCIGLVFGVVAAGLAMVALFFDTLEGPGPGTWLVASPITGALWLGLEGLLLSSVYSVTAPVWGGVRFQTEGGLSLPKSAAMPAVGQPVRAVAMLEPPEIRLPESSPTDVAGCAAASLGSCCLPVVLFPVLWIAWALFSLGMALVGGLEIEIK